MNRGRRIGRKLGLAFVAFIGLSAGAAYFYERAEVYAESHSTYALTNDELSLLQHGDVILRRGYGMVSRMIATRLEGKYGISHCGVIIEREGELYVVHTVSSNVSEIDGMQVHSIGEFVRQSQPQSIVVNRLVDRGAADLLAEGALDYLKAEMLFDHDFNIHDSTHLYCSEMIWRSLKNKAGIDLFEGLYDEEGAWYTFDTFFNPKYFETVINHHAE